MLLSIERATKAPKTHTYILFFSLNMYVFFSRMHTHANGKWKKFLFKVKRKWKELLFKVHTHTNGKWNGKNSYSKHIHIQMENGIERVAIQSDYFPPPTVSCHMLQCVAVCCSVLQCAFQSDYFPPPTSEIPELSLS